VECEREPSPFFVHRNFGRMARSLGSHDRRRHLVRGGKHDLGRVITECHFTTARAVKDAVHAISGDDRNRDHTVQALDRNCFVVVVRYERRRDVVADPHWTTQRGDSARDALARTDHQILHRRRAEPREIAQHERVERPRFADESCVDADSRGNGAYDLARRGLSIGERDEVHILFVQPAQVLDLGLDFLAVPGTMLCSHRPSVSIGKARLRSQRSSPAALTTRP
jgi:hypothetical protein